MFQHQRLAASGRTARYQLTSLFGTFTSVSELLHAENLEPRGEDLREVDVADRRGAEAS